MMTNKIWVVPIEPLDSRYTKQWYDFIPKLLTDRGLEVSTIDGEVVSNTTTPGAFLDFAATNVYKSSQIVHISRLFNDGMIKPGNQFLVTDAWNYAVIAIRYMSDLLDIPVTIHSIFHAGAYDPTDILGMKMQKPWPWHFERSVFHASDYNYFATDFHKNMFLQNLDLFTHSTKAIRSGQPHDLIVDDLVKNFNNPREDIVMWPHRYNPDKQPEIVEDLAKKVSSQFVITQKHNFSKSEYYEWLGKSKVTFSCSLHENLGISQMEGCLSGSIPIVPDRASYSEMYLNCFKYPSIWTESYNNYLQYRDHLVEFVNDKLINYDRYKPNLAQQRDLLINNYMTADIMLDKLDKTN